MTPPVSLRTLYLPGRETQGRVLLLLVPKTVYNLGTT